MKFLNLIPTVLATILLLVSVCGFLLSKETTQRFARVRAQLDRFLTDSPDPRGLDWSQIDATKMKTRRYQFEAAMSQLAFVSFMWLFIWGVSVFFTWIMSSNKLTLGFVFYGATPHTIFFFGVFLAFYQMFIWDRVEENTVRGIVNRFHAQFNSGGDGTNQPEENDGGSRFRIATEGLFLKKFGDSFGKVTEIERERPCPSNMFTVTIYGVSIEIILNLVWLPKMTRISRWFQNGKTEKEREKIITFVNEAAQQAVEEKAPEMVKGSKGGKSVLKVLYVLAHQSELLTAAREAANTEANKYGVNVKSIKFTKCDLPADVQTSLNAAIKADNQIKIAKQLKNVGEGVALIAAVMAGVQGVKIEKTLYGLSTDEAMHKLLEIAATNPEVLPALLLAFKGKK